MRFEEGVKKPENLKDTQIWVKLKKALGFG